MKKIVAILAIAMIGGCKPRTKPPVEIVETDYVGCVSYHGCVSRVRFKPDKVTCYMFDRGISCIRDEQPTN